MSSIEHSNKDTGNSSAHTFSKDGKPGKTGIGFKPPAQFITRRDATFPEQSEVSGQENHPAAELFKPSLQQKNGDYLTGPVMQQENDAYGTGSVMQRKMNPGPYMIKDHVPANEVKEGEETKQEMREVDVGMFVIEGEEGFHPVHKAARGLNVKIRFEMHPELYAKYSTFCGSPGGVYLNMIQSVKTTRPATGEHYPINAQRGAMAISGGEAKEADERDAEEVKAFNKQALERGVQPGLPPADKEKVQAGWVLDVPYENATGGEDFSPFYGDHVEDSSTSNKNVVIIGDFPSAPFPMKYEFETTVIALQTKAVMGVLEWGFVVSGDPLAVSGEYARARKNSSRSFDFALNKHFARHPVPAAE